MLPSAMIQRVIDVYSAGSAEAEDIVDLIESTACRCCAVVVHDLSDAEVAARAQALGLSDAAVVVDEECCAGRAVDPTLRRPDPDAP